MATMSTIVPLMLLWQKIIIILLRVTLGVTISKLSSSLISCFYIGDYQFIDYHALDDQITSSDITQRSSSFRRDIMERDGSMCVFTEFDAYGCDAAHVIPKSKGDQVFSSSFYVIVLLNLLQVYCCSS
jgi:hypothetical protein